VSDIRRHAPSKARARKAMRHFRASLKGDKTKSLRNRTVGQRKYNALYVVRSDRVVKLGVVTSNLTMRLSKHRQQGLWKVVYVLHSPESRSLVELELIWKRYVRTQSGIKVSRQEVPDGYTEAMPLNPTSKSFIDQLLRVAPKSEASQTIHKYLAFERAIKLLPDLTESSGISLPSGETMRST